eukprot:795238-Pelagomonas_calceolata.AAC.1
MPAFIEGFYTEVKGRMASVGVHPTHRWVGTPEQNVMNVVHVITEWASFRTRKVFPISIEKRGPILVTPHPINPNRPPTPPSNR